LDTITQNHSQEKKIQFKKLAKILQRHSKKKAKFLQEGCKVFAMSIAKRTQSFYKTRARFLPYA